jgi:hypothetical protein
MSKKLIAVAAAAALALTALVAVPANATTITTVTINTDTVGLSTGTETASHAASTDAVVAQTFAATRTLQFDQTGTTTRNVIRFNVTTTAATTINITSTLGVRVSASLVDGAGLALKVTDGTQALAGTTASGQLVYSFYAWNTSTTAGALVIETPGSKRSYYVKGKAGAPYNLSSVKFPTTITSGVAEADGAVVSFQVTDAYGNKLETLNPEEVTTSALGATISAETYSTVRLQYEALVFGTAAANVAMSVSLTATDLSANGFAKPVTYAFSSVAGGDLAAQVLTLTAQVATLSAQVAAQAAILAVSRLDENSVTQKKYNTLVRKWNAAFPSQRIALKK